LNILAHAHAQTSSSHNKTVWLLYKAHSKRAQQKGISLSQVQVSDIGNTLY